MHIPENGFYYHYKHDGAKGLDNHAYKVTGLVRHSENDSLLVTYIPLYKNDWLTPAQQCARPIELFFDEVVVDGKALPHFVKITDPQTIATLSEIKNKLYGNTASNWSTYYEKTKNKPPRELLVKALVYVANKGSAIDIGAGALNDTRYLLEQGFEVTAIDSEPSLLEHAASLHNPRLHPAVASYDAFDFPNEKYDIASAMFALPFNPPESFNAMFAKLKNSLKQGGIFCGQFFGVRDEWNKPSRHMTFHTQEQIEKLLEGFEVIFLGEEEKDGSTAAGASKHWHIFHIIAKKK